VRIGAGVVGIFRARARAGAGAGSVRAWTLAATGEMDGMRCTGPGLSLDFCCAYSVCGPGSFTWAEKFGWGLGRKREEMRLLARVSGGLRLYQFV
jgi:hypothetical protein